MRILITGSKGLIGAALKHSLKQLQIDVIGIDIRNDPYDIEFGTILDQPLLSSLIHDVDGVIHLAAVSRVIDGEKNPELCWTTNVQGTKNVLEAALTSVKQPWVIYASSREVYGQPKYFPVSETSDLIPVNIYGRSKLKAEELVQEARVQGLITSIVRFSNVFGSVHDHVDRVVPAFCLASAEGCDLRVDGKDNLFDFTYLEDVIQGLLSLIRLISSERKSLDPVHLTSGTPMSLGQIAQIAKSASEYPIHIHENASRSFDVSKFWGDTSRAKQLLNWKACVTTEEGMLRLINQYRLLQMSRLLTV